jgi:hypothetical protein
MTKRRTKAKRREIALKGWETRRRAALDAKRDEANAVVRTIDRRWLPYNRFRLLDPGRPMLAADLGIEPTRWNEFEWNGSVWDSVDWGKEVDRGILTMMAEAARNPAYGMDPVKFADEYCRIPDILRGLPPDPNPWPRLAAKVRRWWQWTTQWWRP